MDELRQCLVLHLDCIYLLHLTTYWGLGNRFSFNNFSEPGYVRNVGYLEADSALVTRT
jgi:hypothetical protein